MLKFKQFMIRNYKIILSIVLLAGLFFGFNYSNKPDPDKDKELIQTIRYILTQGHYQPKVIDDEMSAEIFDSFIEILDPSKHYFLQSDIDNLSVYKNLIDDQIKTDDLSFFYEVHKLYSIRVGESKQFYKDILETPFNIDIDETISVDYDNKKFATNILELKERWRKELKMRYLSHLNDKETVNKDKLKADSIYVAKSFEEIKIEAHDKTLESMDNLYDRIEEFNRDDWFSFFLNSLTAQFGPHTTYLAPKIKKKFDISMSGKLEGIGARLQKEGDYTKIVSLISGGPAWRAGELEVGDLILKVAQGDKEPLDIVGMRLDDAIEFIKGKKGTEVRLTLKKIDGTIETISIIRDIVELEETFVKSSIVVKDGMKYGLINLPQFYIDFSEKNYRNSATDMAQELARLADEGVDGIMIDLRNNGGGSLKTAVEIAGLFIDKGPVVQVKYRGEDAVVREDSNKGVLWDGKLVILVNEFSASASEILAAAMQDYQRAVIVGSAQTFGKGTVQNVLPLNKYSMVKSNKDLGYLKLTIQKFYRINGGSTQLKGVVPDVIMPSRYAYLDVAERDEKNPMPWDAIEAAKYKLADSYSNIDEVLRNARTRVVLNQHFNLIEQNAKWLKESQEDKTIFLNYKSYINDIAMHEKALERFDSLENYTNNMRFISPEYEIPLMEKDSILSKKREKWHTDLTKDVYINEAVNIIQDLRLK